MNVADLTLHEVAAAYRSKQLSPVEVTAAHLPGECPCVVSDDIVRAMQAAEWLRSVQSFRPW